MIPASKFFGYVHPSTKTPSCRPSSSPRRRSRCSCTSTSAAATPSSPSRASPRGRRPAPTSPTSGRLRRAWPGGMAQGQGVESGAMEAMAAGEARQATCPAERCATVRPHFESADSGYGVRARARSSRTGPGGMRPWVGGRAGRALLRSPFQEGKNPLYSSVTIARLKMADDDARVGPSAGAEGEPAPEEGPAHGSVRYTRRRVLVLGGAFVGRAGRRGRRRQAFGGSAADKVGGAIGRPVRPLPRAQRRPRARRPARAVGRQGRRARGLRRSPSIAPRGWAFSA